MRLRAPERLENKFTVEVTLSGGRALGGELDTEIHVLR